MFRFKTTEHGNIVDQFLLDVTHIMNVNKLYLGLKVRKSMFTVYKDQLP